jgi:fatty acid desaturase
MKQTPIRSMRRASNRIFLEMAALYFCIFTALATVAFVYEAGDMNRLWIVFPLAFCVIGWCQFSLTHALHEVVHYNCGRPHRELLGAMLTAYPIGLTMRYRYVHYAHHKHFGDPELDPEYEAYSNFPSNKLQFLLRLFKNASGFAAVKQFFFQAAPDAPCNKYRETALLLLTHAVIFTAFAVCFTWWAYIVFWVLPIITVAKLCSSTRALCEHGSPDGGPVYRTITGSFLATQLLGMFKFHFHAEHHAHPSIPYSRLPEAHAQMRAGATLQDGYAYEVYRQGHLSLLIDWFCRLPLYGRSEVCHE